MDLVEEVLAGRFQAIARLIRQVEDEPLQARPLLKQLYPHTGRAYLIGLTGSPGVGKSSLVDRLIARFREEGKTVAVVAVDPTSPFSGGAVLGDRVRMQKHATDPGVFIRSLATRGAFGGLTPAAKGVSQVLDAAGFEVILIETVGVGQDEVDVVRLAMTTLVLTVPGLGDDVQAIKAGLMEIADIMVVNKADRPGAEQTVQELKAMLEMNKLLGRKEAWPPRLVAISARTGQGLDQLAALLAEHKRFLTQDHPEILAEKNRGHLTDLVLDLVKEQIVRQTQAVLDDNPAWETKLDEVLARRLDPYTLAEELLEEKTA
ncbi:MAG: methylmalonyl Co-A mutase-associated GTPase MeaB [Deltaproteobacteria bacterium]|nr:methylmalonyl Co-A mutase-associated GTPase MeaB [Deltaproteobacteria bacterium]